MKTLSTITGAECVLSKYLLLLIILAVLKLCCVPQQNGGEGGQAARLVRCLFPLHCDILYYLVSKVALFMT